MFENIEKIKIASFSRKSIQMCWPFLIFKSSRQVQVKSTSQWVVFQYLASGASRLPLPRFMVAYLPGCSLSFMAMMVSDTPLKGAEHMLVRDLNRRENNQKCDLSTTLNYVFFSSDSMRYRYSGLSLTNN